jgi:hypothetical protein
LKPTEEVAALWQAMFGEPPAIAADLDLLARVLVKHLDAAPPYRPTPAANGDGATAASRKA